MRLGLLQIAVLPLLLVGCTSTVAPLPAPTPTTRSPTTTAPAVAALRVPEHLDGEISRDVYTGTSYDGRIGEVPARSERLALHLACAGSGGSQMRWQIQDGRGNQYSAGAVTCNGHEYLETDQSSDLPSAALVHLDADPGVINGWAILTGS